MTEEIFSVDKFVEDGQKVKALFLAINRINTNIDASKYKSNFLQSLRDLEYRLSDTAIMYDKITNNIDLRFKDEIKQENQEQEEII